MFYFVIYWPRSRCRVRLAAHAVQLLSYSPGVKIAIADGRHLRCPGCDGGQLSSIQSIQQIAWIITPTRHRALSEAFGPAAFETPLLHLALRLSEAPSLLPSRLVGVWCCLRDS